LNGISDAGRQRLLTYSWPGNVREIENCVERAVVMARGELLEPGDFVLSGEGKSRAIHEVLEQLFHTDLTIYELDRQLVLMALERCGGNVSQTARVLGMTRRTLQYRMDKIRSGEREPEEQDAERGQRFEPGARPDGASGVRGNRGFPPPPEG
jgi:DNA-binding NtrC family response regulator